MSNIVQYCNQGITKGQQAGILDILSKLELYIDDCKDNIASVLYVKHRIECMRMNINILDKYVTSIINASC